MKEAKHTGNNLAKDFQPGILCLKFLHLNPLGFFSKRRYYFMVLIRDAKYTVSQQKQYIWISSLHLKAQKIV